MDQHSVFKRWIPDQFILPLLILSLFPHMMLLCIFSMNSTFSASFLDIDTDDIQFLFSLAYATIVCGLFINVRLFQFFNIRSFVLTMTIINIVILLLMSTTRNLNLLILLRLIQGPAMLFEGCILLPLIISRIKSDHSRLIAFSFLYGLMLTGDKFATSIVKFAIENFSHQMIYFIIIGLHLLTLFIFLLITNQNRMFSKKPLYQLNLGGIFSMLICLIAGAYVLVYGKKLYWFESKNIITAFVLCVTFAGIFLWRERTAKRPLFHFEIFKSKRVWTGLTLFIFFYLVRSSLGNIYHVMGRVWNWPWYYVLKIQYFNVAGSITGIVIAFFLMRFKVKFRVIFFIGFGLLSISMLCFSYLFYPDTRQILVGGSLFIEGLGQGLLFCPLVFYMLGSVHPSITGSVSQSGTAVRFWTNTIGFSVMQNAVLYLTTKHQFLMTKNIDVTNSYFQEEWDKLFGKFNTLHLTNDTIQLTVGSLKARLYNQALLVANIEIFRTLFVVSLLVALFILIFPMLRSKLKF